MARCSRSSASAKVAGDGSTAASPASTRTSRSTARPTAFLASIGGGKSRSAILLATPAEAARRQPGDQARADAAPEHHPKQDQIQFTAVLKPGKLPRPAAPQKATPGAERSRCRWRTVSGPLVGATSASDHVGSRPHPGRSQGGQPDRRGRSAPRVRIAMTAPIRVAAGRRSSFSAGASAGPPLRRATAPSILVPPFNVRVDVGERRRRRADRLHGEQARRLRCGR